MDAVSKLIEEFPDLVLYLGGVWVIADGFTGTDGI